MAGAWGQACTAAMLVVFTALLLTVLEWGFDLSKELRFLVDIAGTPSAAIDDLPNVSPAALWSVSIFAGLSVLLMTPLSLGLTGWCCALVRGDRAAPGRVLYFFSGVRLFWKALFLRMALFVRRGLWAVLFLWFPAGAFFLFLRAGREGTEWVSLLCRAGTAGAAGLFLLLTGIWFWFCQRYALSLAALAAQPELTVHAAIRRSVRSMRGHAGEWLLLRLSLIGWRLAEFFVLPALWSLPYRTAVYALYAKERLYEEQGPVIQKRNCKPLE